ncbi:MAG: CcoQ/FixQ family Cbb3-type cytochrome c oxidase assembly chaperone [Bacteroidota bacterium]|nr:CcoQ/FixQ family Cbb3-type cytochrome c oxidase assembly chaperone [Bacteroidota bacterium]
MKFIHYIEKIGGVDIFGVISMGIFVLFFLAMLIWVFRTKKKYFNDISRIPLDN